MDTSMSCLLSSPRFLRKVSIVLLAVTFAVLHILLLVSEPSHVRIIVNTPAVLLNLMVSS